MSPQLLLVLMVAVITATCCGLVTRRSFICFPVYWALGVVALLVGQVIGRAAGIGLLNVGIVELGAGLTMNFIALLALEYATQWYNQKNA